MAYSNFNSVKRHNYNLQEVIMKCNEVKYEMWQHVLKTAVLYLPIKLVWRYLGSLLPFG